MEKSLFGNIFINNEVKPIHSYLIGSADFHIKVLDYGATLQSVIFKKNNGEKIDVIGGFDCIDGYLSTTMYQGASVGRVCNRIKNGSFSIDGTQYYVTKNDGINTLHGGSDGINTKIWNVVEHTENKILFEYFSRDGESGFPGNVVIRALYKIQKNSLYINYTATTDKKTPINLTNHSYFNLEGFQKNIYNHTIKIAASKIVDTNEELIPTGKLSSVIGTDFDLRSTCSLTNVLKSHDAKIREMNGLDTCYVFDKHSLEDTVIELYSPKSKIKLDVATDNTSVQIYTSNKCDNIIMKNQTEQKNYFGICIETSYMIDSLNNANFDNIILSPEETYDRTTILKFSEIEFK